ncbi:phage terminase large subunit [Rickettsiales bacterium]|nr:phage terminase large subunit [Rickettsiales bacterium]
MTKIVAGVEGKMRSIVKYQVGCTLRWFLRMAFEVINPGIVFLHNWHLDLICDALQSCVDGDGGRLILNIPPRYLKSVCVSVAFPAWILANDPTKRIIVCSYSKALSLKHAADCRAIMKSDWYRDFFPDSRIVTGGDTQERFKTSSNGFYFATSVGGTLLGEGGDFLIMDDPNDPSSAFSCKKRNAVVEFFNNCLLSRLNNQKSGVIVLVMQRLHEEDLSGFLIENGDSLWQKICVPAIANVDSVVSFNGKDYCIRKKGDVIQESREDINLLNGKMKIMGSYMFSAQYQQSPMSYSNGLVKRSWIKYLEGDYKSKCIKYCISIDCAKSIADSADYTAIAVIGILKDGRHVLVNMIRKRMTYPDLKKKVIDLVESISAESVLVEDASNGASLIQELQGKFYGKIIGIQPRKDKVARFNYALVAIENGHLLFLENSEFSKDFFDELFLFPFGKHDDQVDTISQYFMWLSTKKIRSRVPKIRIL